MNLVALYSSRTRDVPSARRISQTTPVEAIFNILKDFQETENHKYAPRSIETSRINIQEEERILNVRGIIQSLLEIFVNHISIFQKQRSHKRIQFSRWRSLKIQISYILNKMNIEIIYMIEKNMIFKNRRKQRRDKGLEDDYKKWNL